MQSFVSKDLFCICQKYSSSVVTHKSIIILCLLTQIVREVSLHLHISSSDFKAQETEQPIEEEQSQDVFSSTEPSGSSTSKTSKVSESCDIPVGKCAPIILKNKAPRWHEQLQCWCFNCGFCE